VNSRWHKKEGTNYTHFNPFFITEKKYNAREATVFCGDNCTQNRQNEFVDFEAGERLWGGNPSRADLHRTAEPTVGGFLLFCSLEKVWVSLTRFGSYLGS
jgi:hypothetical protein